MHPSDLVTQTYPTPHRGGGYAPGFALALSSEGALRCTLGSRLPCEQLSFQRAQEPPALVE